MNREVDTAVKYNRTKSTMLINLQAASIKTSTMTRKTMMTLSATVQAFRSFLSVAVARRKWGRSVAEVREKENDIIELI